ncbi:GntR family transcriptional regulator [Mesorhizobium sp. BAC0120]|uniref:GntR family transcriptional regulator n=1 Tax=Mesorhizobium sp. BAC0120 TaxID=3090670 RepID=UPI00298C1A2B|nr:GntR family transcriptional regulator [Mesorhizobium sp. BAC0120]MDW6024003.1 GntR family transcriptional regulator [Mesorhizobium sp. BAC0120]
MSDDAFDFEPKPRRVLTDDVVDAIRGAILAGKIKPGARLIEEDLAASLKVSRGPVRQAIFRLQQEGLVVHETHRGATVAQISEDDVSEIYSLRLALERLAIEQAIRKAGARELAEIEAVLTRFSGMPRATVTRRLVAELDVEFHDAIFRAAGSSRLYRAWETLRSQLMMFLMLRDALPEDYLDSWHRDHLRLVEVIRAGDPAAAQAMIEEHINGARARLLAILQASGRLSSIS